MAWDIFLSHASEDKPFVRRLARSLAEAGLRVWYDEFTLDVGDSLRRSIDKGLRDSRYGVVVLSPHFFRKEWPQKELDGLTARDDGSEKLILPVWYNVAAEDVRRFSLLLADKLSIAYAGSTKDVVSGLLRAIYRDQLGSTWSPNPITLPSGISMIPLPVRPVVIRGMLAALCISRFPVTNALYRAFVQDTKRPEPVGEHFVNGIWSGPFAPWDDPGFAEPNQPVVCVDLRDASEFCRWATSSAAVVFLPSGDIWDFVADGGRVTNRPPNPGADQNFHHKSDSPATIAEDGSRNNSLGVSDLFGNVWEWCCYSVDLERASLEAHFLPLLGFHRNHRRFIDAELRGGGYLDNLERVRTKLHSMQLEHGTGTRHSDLGFRVCALVDVKQYFPPGVASALRTLPAAPDIVTRYLSELVTYGTVGFDSDL